MSKNLDKRSISEEPKKLNTQDTSKEIDSLSESVLEKISNSEFLNIKRENRLQHITKPSKKSTEIQNGDTVNFTFTFNDKINTNLYLKTTAGQVLPPTVQELTANNTIWKRSSMLGEFFNSQGSRLIIHNNTQVICSKITSEEEIKNQEVKIVGENKKYESDPNHSIILECAKRNIPHDIVNQIFAPELNKNGKISSLVDIELLITKFERTKDYFAHDFPNIAIQNNTTLAAEFIAYFVSYNHISITDEISNSLGITAEIKRLKDNGHANMGLEEQLIDNGENLKGEALWNHRPFQEKVQAICKELGIDPIHLKKIMEHESQINPKVVNRLTGKATGLIQFMPKTAESLGTTTGKLRVMSGVDQLDYVKKYYAQYANKGLNSVEDLYLATFYPKAIGKPADYVIGSETGNASRIAMENPFPRSGEYVTVADINRFINS